jgi:regulator of sirC expression with transglutaminase-like and TPR domain
LAQQIQRPDAELELARSALYIAGEEYPWLDKEGYYNPENGFLNRVMDTHAGIPITLSLLYRELGRRLALAVVA